MMESALFDVYCTVCQTMKVGVWNGSNGNLAVDGWCTPHNVPVPRMTWHYVKQSWTVQSAILACLLIGTARKSEAQLCAQMQEAQEKHDVSGDVRLKKAGTLLM